jgi:WD repeat-containing protein 90
MTIGLQEKAVKRLQEIYVVSMSGKVFRIGYSSGALEMVFRTNDESIHSISLNETFAVLGSADKYFRLWPLDFTEFIMEAKHGNTVCAVNINRDGLRVACGSLEGSISILDKSNFKYRYLMRSHIAEILSMDFHL